MANGKIIKIQNFNMMQTTTSKPLNESSIQSTKPIDDFEIHLPTLKVVSYNGTGDGSGVPSSLEPLARRIGTRIHWLSVNSKVHADVLYENLRLM